MNINWGDIPTWLAVVVAAIGGFVALRQLRQQSNVIKGEIERNKARDALLDGQLRELQNREVSRIREQAEAIDMTWNDLADPPGKSLVVIINGSRRPIRYVTSWLDANQNFLSPELIKADYGAEMYPADAQHGVDSYVLPKYSETDGRGVWALRAGGRAGFQFSTRRTGRPLGMAFIKFTDDAGYEWRLASDLSLRQVKDDGKQSKDG